MEEQDEDYGSEEEDDDSDSDDDSSSDDDSDEEDYVTREEFSKLVNQQLGPLLQAHKKVEDQMDALETGLSTAKREMEIFVEKESSLLADRMNEKLDDLNEEI